MKELLDPKYGMFRYYEESRLIWFSNKVLWVTFACSRCVFLFVPSNLCKAQCLLLHLGTYSRHTFSICAYFYLVVVKLMYETHCSIHFLMRINNCLLQTFEDIDLFNLIGIICGLAIYNLTIVELNFPVALYKKLLKRKPTLDDLKELMPDVGRSDQGTVICGSNLTCLWMSLCLGIFLTASEIESFNGAVISPVPHRVLTEICHECCVNCLFKKYFKICGFLSPL